MLLGNCCKPVLAGTKESGLGASVPETEGGTSFNFVCKEIQEQESWEEDPDSGSSNEMLKRILWI